MLVRLFGWLKPIAVNRKGVTAAEYAILAVGIVIVVGAAATAFETTLKEAFSNIGTKILEVQGNVGGGGSGTPAN
jgi:Flp pilus assembly pilin Flp